MEERFRSRVWDSETKQMYTGMPRNCEGMELMQCTGVTDSEHFLVYEGDYLTDGESVWQVVFIETMSGFTAKVIAGKKWDEDPNGMFSLWHLCHRCNEGKQVRIVGNIHTHTIGDIKRIICGTEA